jgi:hypothetical protein
MGAQVSSVKSAIESAASLRDIEAALRNTGKMARNDACAVVSRIKALVREEIHAEKSAIDIAKAFGIKI